MGSSQFTRYRRKWESDHSRTHGLATRAYTLSDRIGLTRLIHRAFFHQTVTLERLIHHLDETQPNWRASVRCCYFGHTHEPFAHHQREGITFFNTGSTIRGMPFLPASFTL